MMSSKPLLEQEALMLPASCLCYWFDMTKRFTPQSNQLLLKLVQNISQPGISVFPPSPAPCPTFLSFYAKNKVTEAIILNTTLVIVELENLHIAIFKPQF